MATDAKKDWEAYVAQERSVVTPLLAREGFSVDDEQPHTSGERYLMQAVTTTSGRKLILLGRRDADGQRVVIKIASDNNGMREIEHERVCRKMLPKLGFAYSVFRTPDEVFFGKRAGRLISIQKFIDQESTFLSRPLSEQFSLALKAFKAQEGAHATTYGHERAIAKTYDSMGADAYLSTFKEFVAKIAHAASDELVPKNVLADAAQQLQAGKNVIEQYGDFLTHTDFVPHNIRIHNGDLYLLDASAIRFGNKYEGWARFINFMTLYNPELADALLEYVRLNRTQEEVEALRLMRVYRLGEIIWYYLNTLERCSGNLRELNTERVRFWTHVLVAVLYGERISADVLTAYRTKRDALRSEDEKQRQRGLH